MDFDALLAVASKNNVLNEKLTTKSKTGYNTLLAPAKRQTPNRPKGVMSEKVKAFLEKQAQEEKKKEQEEQKKKEALLKKRQELKNKQAAVKKGQNPKTLEEALRQERERERQVKEQLEEKRRAIIEKLKEAETKGGKRSSASATSSSGIQEYVSEKQRKAEKKLMEKYDNELSSDDDDDIKCDVLSPSKQILDREGYKKRQEQRMKELEKQYKTSPSAQRELFKKSLKSKASGGSSKTSSKHKDKHKVKHKDKHSGKHKEKHRDKHKAKHKDSKDEKGMIKKESKPVPKRPKFVRPNNNRPVLSFQDLLNMASNKQNLALGGTGTEKPVQSNNANKEKTPQNDKPKNDKPKNQRPMTQEEKDRYARRQTKEYKDWLKNGGVLNVGGKNQATESSGTKSEPNSKASSHVDRTKRPDKPITNMPGSGARKEQITSKQIPSTQGKAQRSAPSSSASSDKQEKMPPLVGNKRDTEGNVKKAPQDNYSNPFDRIMGGIKKDHPKKEKRPRVIESDEEEYEDDFIDDDEEDNDFIDDSEAQDYSSLIRNMFKYDPSKYKDEDEDLRSMETGFAQIAAEERRSAKIGLKEDLEDIRREKEEERRKMLLKKKMKLKMKGR